MSVKFGSPEHFAGIEKFIADKDAEIEQLQAKIDRAIEIYGQQFDSPWERARQMWLALKPARRPT